MNLEAPTLMPSEEIKKKDPALQISMVSSIQGLLGICCGIFAVVANGLDERDPSTEDRRADGLYYGLTVLFAMDTVVGIAACVFGLHSAKNWNSRSAYYHFVFTLYNVFCNMLELSTSVYVLFKYSEDSILGLQITLISFTMLSFGIRVWGLRHSKCWQALLFHRQMLRIDPIDTSLPGSIAAQHIYERSRSISKSGFPAKSCL